MKQIRSLREGKLPIHVLRQMLAKVSSKSLVVGPSIGVDVGVSRARGRFIVSSSDPITGTEKRIGWHAVNVSANDVATSGIMPDTLNVVAMFPKGTDATEIEHVMNEISSSAKSLGITVAGGHTEITPQLFKPIVVVTAFGSGSKFAISSFARKSDVILMTKCAGLEGTAIISQLKGASKLLSSTDISEGGKLLSNISILKEAKIAFGTGLVHAMHDVTEGGVLGAVYEMSVASKLGFEVYADQIEVEDCTKRMCEKLRIDPLTLLGSGSLLIATQERNASILSSKLRARGINCRSIGSFVSSTRRRRVIFGNKPKQVKESSIQDGLWEALQKYS